MAILIPSLIPICINSLCKEGVMEVEVGARRRNLHALHCVDTFLAVSGSYANSKDDAPILPERWF